MIKFVAHDKDGRALLGLGLSDENLRRLRKNRPIAVDPRDLGIEGPRIMVFAGPDEDSMRAMLAEYVTLPDEGE